MKLSMSGALLLNYRYRRNVLKILQNSFTQTSDMVNKMAIEKTVIQ